jgi:hypothetical protein
VERSGGVGEMRHFAVHFPDDMYCSYELIWQRVFVSLGDYLALALHGRG